MFRPFLDSLRRHGVPVSLREWLDLMGAMHADMDAPGGDAGGTVLRVDGGMAASDWTMQHLADTLDTARTVQPPGPAAALEVPAQYPGPELL